MLAQGPCVRAPLWSECGNETLQTASGFGARFGASARSVYAYQLISSPPARGNCIDVASRASILWEVVILLSLPSNGLTSKRGRWNNAKGVIDCQGRLHPM